MEKLLTVPEVATILRTTRAGIYYMITEGAIRHTKPGKRILIPESAIRDYLAGGAGRACRVKAGARG